MAESKGGRKWLRCGCFGCLGIIAILIATVLVMFLIARMKVGSEEIAEQVLTPEIPVAVQPLEIDAATTGGGHVILDMRRGGFFIEPAAPGEPLHVEGRYDKNSCELKENFEPDGEEGWTYRLDFSCSDYSLTGILKQMLGGTQPEVHLYLPADQPISLEFDLSQGGSEIELGGLWVTSADLDVEMGGFELRVSEPLRVPMERMKINLAMGGSSISSLGNASPKVLDVEWKMGGMELDLNGNWLQDSDITINGRMGGGVVLLPPDVLVEGVDAGRLTAGEAPEIKPPTLRFTTSIDQGELEIVD
jgi:hypothetical protein